MQPQLRRDRGCHCVEPRCMPSSSEESNGEANPESGGRLCARSPKASSSRPTALALARVGGYELTGKVLGRGNFARVEEGIHMRMQVKVAVKVVDTARIREEYVTRHLEREARMLARLRHPSIAALFETLRSGACYYLVGELAPGGDLCALVRRQRGGRMEERAARRLARQLASALAHMHSRGVVHRDLKMENIMLDAAGRRIKIVDFGLSNAWTPGQPLRTHCGSPEYAAPELFIAGRAYGPEVDLWSLGVVLFGMLAGRLPFLGPRAQDGITSPERRARLLEQINRGLAGPQRRLLSHASPDFLHLERRLLTQDATSRACVGEVLAHPWVTARGAMPPPRADPLPALTAAERAAAARRAAHSLGMPRSRLLAEASASRFGPAGGALNIAVHLMTEQRIEYSGPGSAPSTPPVTPPPTVPSSQQRRPVVPSAAPARRTATSPTPVNASGRPQSCPVSRPSAAAVPRPSTAAPSGGRSVMGRPPLPANSTSRHATSTTSSRRMPPRSPTRQLPSPRPGSTFCARAPSPTLAARCSEALRLFHERAARGRRLHQVGSGLPAAPHSSYSHTTKPTASRGSVLVSVASGMAEGGVGGSVRGPPRRPSTVASSRSPSRVMCRPTSARAAVSSTGRASISGGSVGGGVTSSGGGAGGGGVAVGSSPRSAVVRRSRQAVIPSNVPASASGPVRPTTRASRAHASLASAGNRELLRSLEVRTRHPAEV